MAPDIKSKFIVSLRGVFLGVSSGALAALIPLFFSSSLHEFNVSGMPHFKRYAAVALLLAGMLILLSIGGKALKSPPGGAAFIISGALLAALSVLVSIAELPPWAGIAVSALACASIALQLLTIMNRLGDFRQVVSALFTAGISAAAFIHISGMINYSSPAPFTRAAVMLLLPLIGAAAYFLTPRSDDSGGETYPSAGTNPGRALPRCIMSLLALAAVIVHISCVYRGANTSGVSAVAFLMIIVALAVIYLSSGRAVPWHISYAVLAVFGLGAVLHLINAGPVIGSYVSLMLLAASAGGLCLMFVSALWDLTSRGNRGLAVSVGAVALGSICGLLFSHFNVILIFADIPAVNIALISTAAVFLVIPYLMAHTFPADGTSTGAVLREYPPDTAPEALRVQAEAARSDELPPPSGEETQSEALAEIGSAEEDDRAAPRVSALEEALLAQLTKAERNVYELVVQGYSNKEIAGKLYVSVNTVKFHVKNILAKAGINSKYRLVDFITSTE
ncbi:hypothetical protein FACS1894171_1440 [Clostridia bacterium]|nr:hypothetical protein FACS1894171_1440 [Clostridia bacterium]